MRNRNPLARAGFTLIEVLVTLVLLALLIGVIVPQVVNQLDRGDPTRITADLESVRSAVRLFRVDVKRYPATLEQISELPGASGTNWVRTTDFNGATIGDGLLAQWNGPYLEGSTIMDETATIETALGGQIQPVFVDTLTLGGVTYIAIEVSALDSASIAVINEEIDGDDTLTDPETDGRIRMKDIGTLDFRMYYLAVPVN